MWKKLASRDAAVNLSMLNYLTREFRTAAKLGLLRGDVRIYASGDGFLFNDGAVRQFAILRGSTVDGIAPVDPPDEGALAGYTLVLTTGSRYYQLENK